MFNGILKIERDPSMMDIDFLKVWGKKENEKEDSREEFVQYFFSSLSN